VYPFSQNAITELSSHTPQPNIYHWYHLRKSSCRFLTVLVSLSVLHLRSSNLLLRPIPKFLPLGVVQLHLLALISHNLQSLHLPPLVFPTIPPCLSHQRHKRVLFRPPLLSRHIRQICSSISPSMVREADPQSMLPYRPVHRVFVWSGEICEECHADLEGG